MKLCPNLVVFCFCCLMLAYSLNFTPGEGYSGVIVTLSGSINESYLHDIKEFFKEANMVLYKATMERTKLNEVVFVFEQPSNEYLTDSVTWEAFEHPDIQITDHESLTMQTSFCGEPGLSIILPKYLISEKQGPKTFVQQWVKYRHGVFDERAHDNSHKCYFQNEKWQITGCYDKQPEHNIKIHSGENGLPTCENFGDLEKIFEGVNLSSSLSFSSHLPEVYHFCSGTEEFPHNSELPTLHNNLCDGKSTWDVIAQSVDLKKQTAKVPDSELKFRLVHQDAPRFVFALQSKFTEFKTFLKIFNSLVNLFHDLLPDDFEVGIVSFANDCNAVRDTNITKLNSAEARASIIDEYSYNGTPDGTETCPEKALHEAIEMLRGNSRSDTVIFLGEAEKFIGKIKDMETVLASEDLKFRISAVLFTADKRIELGALQEFFASRRGSLYTVQKNDNWNSIPMALVASINSRTKEYLSVVHLASIASNPAGEEFNTKGDEKGQLIFHAHCEAGRGNRRIFLNGKEAKIHHAETFSHTEDVESSKVPWRYSFKFMTEKPIMCDIMAYIRNSDPSKAALVQSYIKIHQIDGNGILVIYMKVSEDIRSRLIDEYVNVISRGFPNNEMFDLHLNDNGNGDPDFEAGDGIFSGYFVKSDAESSVFHMQRLEISFKGMQDRIVRVYYQMESLVLPHSPVIERLKPSRISNLRVSYLSKGTNDFGLKFTAPGSFLNYQPVKSYDIRYALEYQTFSSLKGFESSPILPNRENPELKLPGDVENFSFNFPEAPSGVFFVAIRAVNKHEWKGRISNIVQVLTTLEPEITTLNYSEATSSTLQTTTIPSTLQSTERNPGNETLKFLERTFWTQKMITIVLSCTISGVILICVIIVIITCYCVARGNKNSDTKDPSKKTWQLRWIPCCIPEKKKQNQLETITGEMTYRKTVDFIDTSSVRSDPCSMNNSQLKNTQISRQAWFGNSRYVRPKERFVRRTSLQSISEDGSNQGPQLPALEQRNDGEIQFYQPISRNREPHDDKGNLRHRGLADQPDLLRVHQSLGQFASGPRRMDSAMEPHGSNGRQGHEDNWEQSSYNIDYDYDYVSLDESVGVGLNKVTTRIPEDTRTIVSLCRSQGRQGKDLTIGEAHWNSGYASDDDSVSSKFSGTVNPVLKQMAHNHAINQARNPQLKGGVNEESFDYGVV